MMLVYTTRPSHWSNKLYEKSIKCNILLARNFRHLNVELGIYIATPVI